MRRLVLLHSLAAFLFAAPAGATLPQLTEIECLTAKLQATAGTTFNLNFVPFFPVFVCGAIISVDGDSTFDIQSFGFQGPGVLTQSCAAATPDQPYQLDSLVLGDLNLFEAYGKLEIFEPLLQSEVEGQAQNELLGFFLPIRRPATPGAGALNYNEVGVTEASTPAVCRKVPKRLFF